MVDRRSFKGWENMRTSTFKSVKFSNTKKQIDISYTSGEKVCVHFKSLGIKQNIKEVMD